ncbi:16S rRNA (guanine(966)-N(2))-methyltransferase RsmD [Erysipelotrichaceae bacterium OttesenSCG-928-M19]|nr:16S rRNA (guanine(966)-N(2))-methyltransferase RsmD [Erysipelotrichaceae bacterium OttesenSCG-928-M19]
MNVVRGKYRGLKLATLKNTKTRPTSTKAKEAIFSMLNNHIADVSVLDLFAGSGSLGIEALSNGALRVDFFDKNYEAISIIKENCAKLHDEDYTITKMAYQQALAMMVENNKSYDLIFLDPPYDFRIINDLLKFIITNNLITNNGIIVCELSLDEEILDEVIDYEKYKDKKYSSSRIVMYRRR